jgi:electron transfer flavoprotein beta subunit
LEAQQPKHKKTDPADKRGFFLYICHHSFYDQVNYQINRLMKILVCLGNVPDTTTKIKFSGDGTVLDKTGVQWIINPWDELALTRAIELKESGQVPVEVISVITVGGADAEPTLRKALAIGADSGYRIDAEPVDSYQVAYQIAEVARQEQYDVILCGIESSDYNGSATGSMLAEILDYPSLSAVSGIDLANGQLVFTRDIDGGRETVNLDLPAVLIVQKGIAKEPRIPAMRGIMMARQKPLTVKPPVALNGFTEMISFELPAPKPSCRKIDPDNVRELVSLLQNEAKVL